MANVNQALTGKRVYRSSSYAPTRGTNNPQGYVERELRKQNAPQRAQKLQPLQKAQPLAKQMPGTHGVSQVGNDGQSDTRSGMAARTLMRNPPRPLTRPRNNMVGNAQAAVGHMMGRNRPGAGGGGKPFNTYLQRPPLTTSQYEPISINSNGRLDLPFSYAAGQNGLQQTQQANQQLQDLQQQQQQQASEYIRNLRDTGQQYDVTRRQTLSGNAARGTAFSSGYGVQVGQNATDYNNRVGDLNMQHTQAENGFTAQRNGIQANLNDFLRQQALERGMQLQGQTHMPYGESGKPIVGSLGFGTSKSMVAIKRPGKKAGKRR